jgi:hypothetical protein
MTHCPKAIFEAWLSFRPILPARFRYAPRIMRGSQRISLIARLQRQLEPIVDEVNFSPWCPSSLQLAWQRRD